MLTHRLCTPCTRNHAATIWRRDTRPPGRTGAYRAARFRRVTGAADVARPLLITRIVLVETIHHYRTLLGELTQALPIIERLHIYPPRVALDIAASPDAGTAA